ncbi:MAG TPA: DNA topoisomerase I, partial [Acholeplasmataceae bacterium]|nr:DNA topoisomerase I [Acholeplasmataceae bacterium]
MKTVIIVESPSKSKTIANYVGNDTVVLATVGHIRELATSGTYGLGIDLANDFKPNYKVSKGKEKVIKELIKQTQKSNVLIATDPDREGEAIAWHVADILNLDLEQNNRITFNEVTKEAVLKAVSEPRKIDRDLVHSQEARRILDRIIGFRLSKLLQQKIGSKSAG